MKTIGFWDAKLQFESYYANQMLLKLKFCRKAFVCVFKRINIKGDNLILNVNSFI